MKTALTSARSTPRMRQSGGFRPPFPSPARPLVVRALRPSTFKSALALFAALLVPQNAQASMFAGEQLDKIANVLAWVVLIVAPAVGIGVFWLVHILPEKIAEKRHHPQAKAIQCLCLLSLVFGGLLWPLAWLWAYSKPVIHKLAYGTDVHEPEDHLPEPGSAEEKDLAALSDEAARLRGRVAELEAQLKNGGAKP